MMRGAIAHVILMNRKERVVPVTHQSISPGTPSFGVMMIIMFIVACLAVASIVLAVTD